METNFVPASPGFDPLFTFNVPAVTRQWNKDMIQILDDLIDGGIEYWCAIDTDAELPKLPVLYAVIECETRRGFDEPQRQTITLETLATGIAKILSGEFKVQKAIIADVATFVATNDPEHLDVEDMDLIVQAGLYDEVTWG
jgi:hypothetical protein